MENKAWKELVTEYVINEYKLDLSEDYEIVEVPARQLISSKRIDLMAKWLYIDAYVNNRNTELAIEIYRAHLDAFSYGKFVEYGQEDKDSFDKYLKTFNELIDNIKENGFDAEKSLVPVGKDDIILDGAHRVSICAYFNKNIKIIRFPKAEFSSDTFFFKRNLMSDKYLSPMAEEYVRHDENCYFACLWPTAYDKEKQRLSEVLLSWVGEIVYSTDLYMDFEEFHRFIATIYGHQSWIGTKEDNFRGARGKAKACFIKGKPIHTVIFKASSLEDVVKVKKYIRDLYQLENHSVHISDDVNETRQIAELLYGGKMNTYIPAVEKRKEKLLAEERKMGLYGRGLVSEKVYLKEKIKRLINWKGINDK